MAGTSSGNRGSDRTMTREPAEFLCRGTRCAATLYRPEGPPERPPVVIMAHGFGAHRSFALPSYAERFAAAGLAVLLFDYRCLGESDGQPRDLVSFRRQRDDWRAAVQHVRTRGDVDAGRIALWGTSYSGGHVMAIAAQLSGISAIVLQVPMVDVPASLPRFGARYLGAATWHALRDLSRIGLGLKPYYVPIIGPPDTFAVLNRPGCEAGYRSLIPPGAEWANRCPARELILSLRNRPIAFARQIRCPALVIAAEADQLIPPRTVVRAARRMPHSTLIRHPGDHFSVYTGADFETLVSQQTEFLCTHLKAAGQ